MISANLIVRIEWHSSGSHSQSDSRHSYIFRLRIEIEVAGQSFVVAGHQHATRCSLLGAYLRPLCLADLFELCFALFCVAGAGVLAGDGAIGAGAVVDAFDPAVDPPFPPFKPLPLPP